LFATAEQLLGLTGEAVVLASGGPWGRQVRSAWPAGPMWSAAFVRFWSGVVAHSGNRSTRRDRSRC